MRRLIAHALVITAIFDIADSKKSSNEIYIMLILAIALYVSKYTQKEE